MGERRLELAVLDDLRPHPDNPKGHDLPALDESLDRFGYADVIVVDERTGLLASGHGRWQQLLVKQQAGQAPPDGVQVDRDGRWLVPVVRGWASKDDLEARAYLVAANRLTETGGWLDDLLVQVLGPLRDADALAGIGYTEHDVDDMLAHLAPPPDLDDLADQYGDPDPTLLWPVLRFKVPPLVRDRFYTATRDVPGDDSDKFAALVDRAELAHP